MNKKINIHKKNKNKCIKYLDKINYLSNFDYSTHI